jgi:hypothetical protein
VNVPEPREGTEQSERGSCLVLIKGNLDCDHVLTYHGMSSRDGVAFAEYECSKCGRLIAQRAAEAEPPDPA